TARIPFFCEVLVFLLSGGVVLVCVGHVCSPQLHEGRELTWTARTLGRRAADGEGEPEDPSARLRSTALRSESCFIRAEAGCIKGIHLHPGPRFRSHPWNPRFLTAAAPPILRPLPTYNMMRNPAGFYAEEVSIISCREERRYKG